jgi:hypothetical protein
MLGQVSRRYLWMACSSNHLSNTKVLTLYRLEPSTQELLHHGHTRYVITVGAQKRDTLVHQHYRACPRKPVNKTFGNQPNGSEVCGCCLQRKLRQDDIIISLQLERKLIISAFMEGTKIYRCTSCPLVSCTNCRQKGPVSGHPHAMIPVSLFKNYPPADLWKSMLDADIRGCAQCKSKIS